MGWLLGWLSGWATMRFLHAIAQQYKWLKLKFGMHIQSSTRMMPICLTKSIINNKSMKSLNTCKMTHERYQLAGQQTRCGWVHICQTGGVRSHRWHYMQSNVKFINTWSADSFASFKRRLKSEIYASTYVT